jgi:integrase
MYVRVDKHAKKTQVFTPDQLKVLFASPLFTSCASDTLWHKPGAHLIRDHRYWLPHVMMWSGARPGEIAQLLVTDVKELHGHWVMHITEEGGGDKRVKTRGSQRVVPIHSRLIELGFLDHWRNAMAAGQARLFPEAVRSSTGQMAHLFETKFGKYLTKLGLKEGRGLSLYSFRHGFADAMRRAGYMDEEFGFLMGHSKTTTTGIYGQLPEGMLEKRVRMIEAVSYP